MAGWLRLSKHVSAQSICNDEGREVFRVIASDSHLAVKYWAPERLATGGGGNTAQVFNELRARMSSALASCPSVVLPLHVHISREGGMVMIYPFGGLSMDAVCAELRSAGDKEALVQNLAIMATSVLQTLQKLQAQRPKALVHGDVKLENLLRGDDGAVRLADFGNLCEEGDTSTAHDPTYFPPDWAALLPDGRHAFEDPLSLSLANSLVKDLRGLGMAIIKGYAGQLPPEVSLDAADSYMTHHPAPAALSTASGASQSSMTSQSGAHGFDEQERARLLRIAGHDWGASIDKLIPDAPQLNQFAKLLMGPRDCIPSLSKLLQQPLVKSVHRQVLDTARKARKPWAAHVAACRAAVWQVVGPLVQLEQTMLQVLSDGALSSVPPLSEQFELLSEKFQEQQQEASLVAGSKSAAIALLPKDTSCSALQSAGTSPSTDSVMSEGHSTATTPTATAPPSSVCGASCAAGSCLGWCCDSVSSDSNSDVAALAEFLVNTNKTQQASGQTPAASAAADAPPADMTPAQLMAPQPAIASACDQHFMQLEFSSGAVDLMQCSQPEAAGGWDANSTPVAVSDVTTALLPAAMMTGDDMQVVSFLPHQDVPLHVGSVQEHSAGELCLFEPQPLLRPFEQQEEQLPVAAAMGCTLEALPHATQLSTRISFSTDPQLTWDLQPSGQQVCWDPWAANYSAAKQEVVAFSSAPCEVSSLLAAQQRAGPAAFVSAVHPIASQQSALGIGDWELGESMGGAGPRLFDNSLAGLLCSSNVGAQEGSRQPDKPAALVDAGTGNGCCSQPLVAAASATEKAGTGLQAISTAAHGLAQFGTAATDHSASLPGAAAATVYFPEDAALVMDDLHVQVQEQLSLRAALPAPACSSEQMCGAVAPNAAAVSTELPMLSQQQQAMIAAANALQAVAGLLQMQQPHQLPQETSQQQVKAHATLAGGVLRAGSTPCKAVARMCRKAWGQLKLKQEPSQQQLPVLAKVTAGPAAEALLLLSQVQMALLQAASPSPMLLDDADAGPYTSNTPLAGTASWGLAAALATDSRSGSAAQSATSAAACGAAASSAAAAGFDRAGVTSEVRQWAAAADVASTDNGIVDAEVILVGRDAAAAAGDGAAMKVVQTKQSAFSSPTITSTTAATTGSGRSKRLILRLKLSRWGLAAAAAAVAALQRRHGALHM